jgi:hypothetical protein
MVVFLDLSICIEEHLAVCMDLYGSLCSNGMQWVNHSTTISTTLLLLDSQ